MKILSSRILINTLACVSIGATASFISAQDSTLPKDYFGKERVINDSDGDGWDDLWCALFPEVKHRDLKTDTDGDQLTDYQEMLLWRDPIVEGPLPVKLTAEEILANQKQSEAQQAAADLEKRRQLAPLISQGRATVLAAQKATFANAEVMAVQAATAVAAKSDPAKTDLGLSREAAQNEAAQLQKDINRAITPEVQAQVAPPGSGLRIRSIRAGEMELESSFNLEAAGTIRSQRLWPSTAGAAPIGDSPLPDLTGNGRVIGIWEAGGGVFAGHSELGATRVDLSNDDPTQNGLPIFHSHATAVAGTLIGAGNAPLARGVAYQGSLVAYDSFSDTTEMSSAAALGMTLSNHSYGIVRGWRSSPARFGSNTINWRWIGGLAGLEDAGMGLYTSSAREIDILTMEHPNYLPVYSAGNQNGQGQQGPVLADGTIQTQFPYYRIHDDDGDGIFVGQIYFTTFNPVNPSFPVQNRLPNPGNPLPGAITPSSVLGNPGYTLAIGPSPAKTGLGLDTLSGAQVSKNALVVGAIEDLSDGVSDPAAVKSAIFSSRGPTDDGRIKPEIVANGTTFITSDAVGTSSSLPLNVSFESPSLVNDASSANLNGWSQDIGVGGAEIRRDDNGRAVDRNHLVVKNLNHKVWQDFGASLSLQPNQQYLVRAIIGRKAFDSIADTGSSPNNLTRVRLYVGAGGGSFGTLVQEWTLNVSQVIQAPVAPRTINWINQEFLFSTGGAAPTGILRLVLENAGPAHSYFDDTALELYDSSTLTTADPESGTSFSAPSVTGGIAQLEELQALLGKPPLSASARRGLVTHTASDLTKAPAILGLGTLFPGPDPFYGYGAANFEAAAELIAKNAASASGRSHIRNMTLLNGNTFEKTVTVDGTRPLKVVISYTDPAWQNAYTTATAADQGVPNPNTSAIDPTTSRLVNDLDLVVITPGNTQIFPYKLDPANLTAAATTGDNDVDNLEECYIANPVAGDYMIRVSHEGSLMATKRLIPGDPGYGTINPNRPTEPRYQLLNGGAQTFSLIIDGNTPTSADELKVTTFQQTNSDHIITWQSEKGLAYQVERSADLELWEGLTPSGTWVPLAGNPLLLSVTATLANSIITLNPPTPAADKLFYRIKEVILP